MEEVIKFLETRNFLRDLSSELVTNFTMHLILEAYQTLYEWPIVPILW